MTSDINSIKRSSSCIAYRLAGKETLMNIKFVLQHKGLYHYTTLTLLLDST